MEPDVTVAGKAIVIVGLVPALWHWVQVVPLLPEYPAMPPGYAWAEVGSNATSNANKLR